MAEYSRSFISMSANQFGHDFEKSLEMACRIYSEKGIGYIVKEPEPFRVIKKLKAGKAEVQFTGHAEPDFHGTIKINNKAYSIVFEAKSTTSKTKKIKLDVISEHQAKALTEHFNYGALAYVAVRIDDGNIGNYFFIPWKIWRNGREIFGRSSLSAEDLEPYRVPVKVFVGGAAVMFLNNLIMG